MDPDGCVEVLIGEDEDGTQYLEHQYVGHYRHDCTSLGRTRPWKRTEQWISPSQEYDEADFAWALSRILRNISSTYDLKSLKVGLTDEECGRILAMRNHAIEKTLGSKP